MVVELTVSRRGTNTIVVNVTATIATITPTIRL
jgi:hypothetical protein